ncbi:replication terminator protein [Oceanidesulfovibrio marinus]|uniref:Replication terminator protein n=1 Tax=Oceanidesulfovibrio marinus TaxID=370038 RepID=A0A6P1ZBZ5_9BACT|nr:replication terminator protein [Oceanidesulfovibrio marinus]TVM31208.1 replication terminator protein [Oceanidesulfovibrio marinus]
MSKPLSLATLHGGGAVERVNLEIRRVLENIRDVNTDPKKMRQVELVLKFKPNEHRNLADVEIHVKTKIAPPTHLTSSVLIDKDEKGHAVGAEHAAGGLYEDQHAMPPAQEQRDKVINLERKG